jgi:hypothetical protein
VKVLNAVAELLKRVGGEFLSAYPLNPIIDAAAAVDIRPIIVRQEWGAGHMADAFTRPAAASEAASSRCSAAPVSRMPSAPSPTPTPSRCRSSCCPAPKGERRIGALGAGEEAGSVRAE